MVLAVALAESAALAAARPVRVLASLEGQRRALASDAQLFARRSGCGVSTRGIGIGTRVTDANSKRLARSIYQDAYLPDAFNGRCTGVTKLAAAIQAGKVSKADAASYRRLIRGQLKRGDSVFEINWSRRGGARFSTLADVTAAAQLRFDPLISGYARPAALQQPSPPVSSATASQATSTLLKWTWEPWGGEGSCVAETFGVCRVRKFVNMSIVTDPSTGQILNEAETVSVSATLAKAERRFKAEKVKVGTMECKRVTVQVYWSSPVGSLKAKAGTEGFNVDLEVSGIGSSGVDEEVYTLCANGSTEVI